jgi:RNA-binding protein
LKRFFAIKLWKMPVFVALLPHNTPLRFLRGGFRRVHPPSFIFFIPPMPAFTATPAQRATLRASAHALHPVVMIGADGLTDAVLAEVERALKSHQLIKIRVHGDERAARVTIYETICERLKAAPIQHIGKLLVVWRPDGQEAASAVGARRGNLTAAAGGATARAARAPRTGGRAGGVPAAAPRVRAGTTGAARAGTGGSPRVVTIIKANSNPSRRPIPKQVTVLGNERVTFGGEVKKAKKRQSSVKRQRQSTK